MPRSKTKGVTKKEVQVSITTSTILKTLLIIMGAALIFVLRDIVAIFLAALMLAALVEPAGEWFKKRGVPRGIGVGLVYALIVAIGVGVLVLVVPTTLEQTREIAVKYEPVVEKLKESQPLIAGLIDGDLLDRNFDEIIVSVQESGLTDAFPRIVEYVTDTFSILITLLLVFVIAYYMVIEEDLLKADVAKWLAPTKYRKFVTTIGPKIRERLGAWLRAQLLIMFIVFALTFIVLSVLGMPFALVLAIIAGLLEIVPFLGPMIAVIPAFIVALSISPLQAFIIGVFYFLIQQLEGDVLSPKIMQKVAGLNPIIAIFAILIGLKVGIFGAILAIPFTMVIGVLIVEFSKSKK